MGNIIYSRTQNKIFDVILHIVIFQNVILVHTLQIMYNICYKQSQSVVIIIVRIFKSLTYRIIRILVVFIEILTKLFIYTNPS